MGKGLSSTVAAFVLAIAMMVNGAAFAELREIGTQIHLSAHEDPHEHAKKSTHVHKHRHAPDEPEHEHQHMDPCFFATMMSFDFSSSTTSSNFKVELVVRSSVVLDETQPTNSAISSLFRPPIA